MNGVSLISLVVLMACFLGVLVYNAGQSGVDRYYFSPPYYYKLGDGFAMAVAFSFVLTFSLLFFGLAAPAAMAVEGLKFGSFFSAGLIPAYDLILIIPQVLAMLAATTIGEGVMADWSGKSTIFDYWAEGMKYAVGGLIFLGAYVFIRPFVVS